MMDLVVLDDPLYAFDESDALFDGIGFDRLLHVDRGPSICVPVRAQRLGSASGVTGREYRIERTERSLAHLARSNLSYFVNESLAARRA